MMPRITENIVHGGQTQLHKLRMLSQVILTTLSISLVSGILYFGLSLSQKVSCFEMQVTGSYALARVLDGCALPGITSFKTVPFPGPKGLSPANISWVLSNKEIQKLVGETTSVLKAQVFETALVTGLILIMVTWFWIHKGRKRRENKLLSGTVVTEPKNLKILLKKAHPLSPIEIAGVPLLKGSETQHLMFAGTTGTGKSNAINELLLQIRALKHKAIIVDTTSLMVSKFFREERDYLLNPLDTRAQAWHLWIECQHNADIEALAETMIPQTSTDPFWNHAARIVFVAAIKKLAAAKNFSTDNLLDLSLRQPLNQLHKALEGTEAASMVDPGSDKMALSIRATLSTHIQALESIRDTQNPFSIRRWMYSADDSWLFLNCLPRQRASMRPLLSGWLSIAMRALMDKSPSQDRKVWFIIDELPSLNVLNDLPRALSELRKYGGCCVLGIQDLSQLDELYGQHVTRSIAGLTGTKVIFRAADEYNAVRFSNFLGTQEVIESNESITFGAHQVRDGVSLSEHRHTKPVVSAHEIMSLNDLEAYLSLPGNVPLANIRFDYHELAKQAEVFVPKVNVGEINENKKRTS